MFVDGISNVPLLLVELTYHRSDPQQTALTVSETCPRVAQMGGTPAPNRR